MFAFRFGIFAFRFGKLALRFGIFAFTLGIFAFIFGIFSFTLGILESTPDKVFVIKFWSTEAPGTPVFNAELFKTERSICLLGSFS